MHCPHAGPKYPTGREPFVRAGDLRGNLAERRHLFYGCEAHELEVLEGAERLNNTGDCRRIVESETSKMAKTLGPLLTVP